MSQDVIGLSGPQLEHPTHLRRIVHNEENIVIALARRNVLHDKDISRNTYEYQGTSLQASSDTWKRNQMNLCTRTVFTGALIALLIFDIENFDQVPPPQ